MLVNKAPLALSIVLSVISSVWAVGWDPTQGLVGHWAFDDYQNPYKATAGPDGGQNGAYLNVDLDSAVGDGAAYMGGLASMSIFNISSLQPVFKSNTISYSFWIQGFSSAEFLLHENVAFQGHTDADSGTPHTGFFIVPSATAPPTAPPGSNAALCWLNGDVASDQLIHWTNRDYLKDIMLDKWAHFAMTDEFTDGTTSTMKLYINGQLVSTKYGSSAVAINLPFFAIGSRPHGVDRVRGMMDDFRIYNGILDGGQVQQLYEMGVPEPTTMCLLGLGALAIIRKKSR